MTEVVSAGPHGPLYSVSTPSGQVLIANATLDQIQIQQPAIYRQLSPLMATQGEDGRKPRRIDPHPIVIQASSAVR